MRIWHLSGSNFIKLITGRVSYSCFALSSHKSLKTFHISQPLTFCNPTLNSFRNTASTNCCSPCNMGIFLVTANFRCRPIYGSISKILAALVFGDFQKFLNFMSNILETGQEVEVILGEERSFEWEEVSIEREDDRKHSLATHSLGINRPKILV